MTFALPPSEVACGSSTLASSAVMIVTSAEASTRPMPLDAAPFPSPSPSPQAAGASATANPRKHVAVVRRIGSLHAPRVRIAPERPRDRSG
jgi:hypothetical protein